MGRATAACSGAGTDGRSHGTGRRGAGRGLRRGRWRRTWCVRHARAQEDSPWLIGGRRPGRPRQATQRAAPERSSPRNGADLERDQRPGHRERFPAPERPISRPSYGRPRSSGRPSPPADRASRPTASATPSSARMELRQTAEQAVDVLSGQDQQVAEQRPDRVDLDEEAVVPVRRGDHLQRDAEARRPRCCCCSSG